MRTGEESRVEQVGEPYAARVLRLAGEPWNGNFGQRRPRLTQYVEIFRRIPLPLFRDGLVRAFDDFIAGRVPPARRVVPHHWHFDMNDGFRFGLDERLASSHDGGGIHNCSNDVRVRGTSANVARER